MEQQNSSEQLTFLVTPGAGPHHWTSKWAGQYQARPGRHSSSLPQTVTTH